MRHLLAVGLAALILVAVAHPLVDAQATTARPARATVFIRLLGQVEMDPAPEGVAQALRQRELELGTGSGFLFSAYGHVLTCAHVVRVEPGTATIDGVRTTLKPILRRIEVLLPADDEGGPPRIPYEATVVAADEELDLAVLSISSTGTPFLHLGDSDAADSGDAVEAIGYPFGRRLEIARPSAGEFTAPTASISRGNVSASRLNAQGERRFLQTTAALNAGNSGGPILDADGFVLGIANSIFTARNAPTGVGFAVPVNLVKRFLEAHSLDNLLDARAVHLGAATALDGKGIRVALPLGLADQAPVRWRVDTGGDAAQALAFHLDRVVSPWPGARLAEALTSGQAFEPISATSAPAQKMVEINGRSVLIGRVAGTLPGGADVRMEYAVLDVGGEKVVARYVGPPSHVAFNSSVLRASLRTLEAEALRSPGRERAGAPAWKAAEPRGTPLDRVPVGEGWVREPVVPYACPGLPGPVEVISQSPPGNFALALRAGWLKGVGDPAAAAGACGGGSADDAGYERQVEALGTRYLVIGRFLALPGGDVLQLEGSAPVVESATLRATVAAWLGRWEPS